MNSGKLRQYMFAVVLLALQGLALPAPLANELRERCTNPCDFLRIPDSRRLQSCMLMFLGSDLALQCRDTGVVPVSIDGCVHCCSGLGNSVNLYLRRTFDDILG